MTTMHDDHKFIKVFNPKDAQGAVEKWLIQATLFLGYSFLYKVASETVNERSVSGTHENICITVDLLFYIFNYPRNILDLSELLQLFDF